MLNELQYTEARSSQGTLTSSGTRVPSSKFVCLCLGAAFARSAGILFWESLAVNRQERESC
jgi:hypothetical protein